MPLQLSRVSNVSQTLEAQMQETTHAAGYDQELEDLGWRPLLYLQLPL